MKRKRELKFKPWVRNVKIEHKDDPILLRHLIEFLLLALELADIEDRDEIEKIQKISLDKY